MMLTTMVAITRQFDQSSKTFFGFLCCFFGHAISILVEWECDDDSGQLMHVRGGALARPYRHRWARAVRVAISGTHRTDRHAPSVPSDNEHGLA